MAAIVIFISSICIFCLRSLYFGIGAFIERRKMLSESELKHYPFVSVIVPARNEENNIQACIESIAKNSFPNEHFEIIAVNDRSSDDTGKILENLQRKITNLKIQTITNVTANKNLRGKPGAIEAGIKAAKGSIILMTDADCTVDEHWIAAITKRYEDEDVGLVASFTNIQGNSIFEKIQAVEWAYMHTMGSAGIGLNQPMGCYGNNMSVRKNDFDNLGGYENIKFSVTEDLALLQAVNKTGRKIRYITDPDADVNTLPCKNLKEYFNQHHRWAIGGLKIGWKAAIFVLASSAIWAGIITAFIIGQPLWAGIIILARIICDFTVIAPTLVTMKKIPLIPWIIPSVIFFTIVEAIVPFLLLNKNIKWKGQTFKKH